MAAVVVLIMRHFGMRVVGEGVERAGQLEVLLGCDAVQGYLPGRPAEATDIDLLGQVLAPEKF